MQRIISPIGCPWGTTSQKFLAAVTAIITSGRVDDIMRTMPWKLYEDVHGLLGAFFRGKKTLQCSAILFWCPLCRLFYYRGVDFKNFYISIHTSVHLFVFFSNSSLGYKINNCKKYVLICWHICKGNVGFVERSADWPESEQTVSRWGPLRVWKDKREKKNAFRWSQNCYIITQKCIKNIIMSLRNSLFLVTVFQIILMSVTLWRRHIVGNWNRILFH